MNDRVVVPTTMTRHHDVDRRMHTSRCRSSEKSAKSQPLVSTEPASSRLQAQLQRLLPTAQWASGLPDLLLFANLVLVVGLHVLVSSLRHSTSRSPLSYHILSYPSCPSARVLEHWYCDRTSDTTCISTISYPDRRFDGAWRFVRLTEQSDIIFTPYKATS
ncbi:hypothetical protein BV25DRAFT_406797 [Artomyces pyxidatus]|uniref:Uncharacterized protein n=1 Tax=Artomyces pyxidatus TaxID=48021 RepID=A0ACB8T588_9AGAM|nr:hypothetical protein BV25DRAFT_406797 [Artomyces pyxidatus]